MSFFSNIHDSQVQRIIDSYLASEVAPLLVKRFQQDSLDADDRLAIDKDDVKLQLSLLKNTATEMYWAIINKVEDENDVKANFVVEQLNALA